MRPRLSSFIAASVVLAGVLGPVTTLHAQAAEPVAVHVAPTAPTPLPPELIAEFRNPGLAKGLALVGGGSMLGHWYAGESKKALTLMSLSLLGGVAAAYGESEGSSALWLGGAATIIGSWIYAVSDADDAARRTNARLAASHRHPAPLRKPPMISGFGEVSVPRPIQLNLGGPEGQRVLSAAPADSGTAGATIPAVLPSGATRPVRATGGTMDFGTHRPATSAPAKIAKARATATRSQHGSASATVPPAAPRPTAASTKRQAPKTAAARATSAPRSPKRPPTRSAPPTAKRASAKSPATCTIALVVDAETVLCESGARVSRHRLRTVNGTSIAPTTSLDELRTLLPTGKTFSVAPETTR